jgi:hypothetical protein
MEASYDLTDMAMDQNSAGGKGDENLYVQFFTAPLQDKERTEEEGRPIFKDVDMIRIMVPGDKDNIIERAVRQGDSQRFPKQWEAYKQGREEALEGTPLEQWPMITRAQVEELRFFHVKTVEQLANISDSNAQKFIGIQALKTRAAEWLEAAEDGAPISAMAAELEKRDEKINSLTATIEQMQEEMKALRESEEDD